MKTTKTGQVEEYYWYQHQIDGFMEWVWKAKANLLLEGSKRALVWGSDPSWPALEFNEVVYAWLLEQMGGF